MSKFDDFLKDSLAYAESRKVPPEPLSPEAEEAIKAELTKFGKPRSLSIMAMKMVVLKLLSEGRLTGSQIIEKLEQLRLALDTPGDGAILGMLHQMESEGTINVEFDAATAPRHYQISDSGSAILNKGESETFAALGLSNLFTTE